MSGAAEGARPDVRRPVAVVMSRFPLLTETFVLREIIELERQGQPVVVVPLLRERPAVAHEEAAAWVDRALYTPFLSPAVAAACLRQLSRKAPRRLAGAARALRDADLRPGALLRTLALLPKCLHLAERLREAGVGHVHAHFATYPATAALLVSELSGIPWSFTIHAHDLFVERFLLERKLRRARFVRVVSEFNRRYVQERYPDAGLTKLRVIHVGVPPGPDAGPAPVSSVPRILCVAALRPYKGLHVLVEACRLLRESGLTFEAEIVGGGPLLADLRQRIRSCGLGEALRLSGPLRQDEVARRLSSASVAVLPSVVAPSGQMDAIPVALMEAMGAGLPVVASALSGIPELVEDGVSGLLVPPGDPRALAQALGRVLEDPFLARRLGQEAVLKVRREFDLEHCTAALLREITLHSLPPDPAWGAPIAAWPQLAGRRVGLRHVHDGPEDRVARLLVSDDGVSREMVVKVHREHAGEPRPPAESAEREAAALCRLERCLEGVAGSGVPRLLGLDRDSASILMEACRGRLLSELLREARARGPSAVVAALGRTADWLRRVQERTREHADAAPCWEALRLQALEDLRICRGSGRVGPRLGRRLSARLSAPSPRPGSVASRVAWHHGDFWPGNVFVSDDRVEVVDLEGWREGLAYEDAACFMVHLDLFAAHPRSRPARRLLRAAFLDAYLAGEPLDGAAWGLCRTAKALEILKRAGGRSPKDRWRRHALRVVLRRPER